MGDIPEKEKHLSNDTEAKKQYEGRKFLLLS